jgi:hypothetical protein
MRTAGRLAPIVSLAWVMTAHAAQPAPVAQADSATSCSRTCLRSMADRLMTSIAAHDPAQLPLSRTYAATENGVPAAVPMMSTWRMASGIGGRFYAIDPAAQQVFFMVTMKEGAADALLFGRFQTWHRRLSQIELYVDRSRGDGGFMFDGRGPGHFPPVWTENISAARLPSRAALLQAGRSMFDPAVAGPPVASSCRLMENGRLVAEDPKVLKWVDPSGNGLRPNPDGTLPIPCGLPPNRPADPHARVVVVDPREGVVVSIATVQGVVQPYLITDPAVSAFIPLSLLQPYMDMLHAQRASRMFTLPAVRGMPASNTTVQMWRIFDGKLQAMQLVEHLQPPGSVSPWMAQSGGIR